MARILGQHALDRGLDAGACGAGERLPSDPDALGALLAELEPRLRAVALRFTRDPANAADVVQNAFEKAIRHRDHFRGEARISTWLHRIVANEALMWLRGEKRRGETFVASGDEPGVIDPAPSPCASLAERERRERISRGLASLRDDEREVLTCCALEGKSYAEYGRAAGLHPSAVKSRAFRARRRLGIALESA